MTAYSGGFVPDWPAPANVSAFISTRDGGCSLAPYDGNNFGTHVGDQPQAVEQNRRQLRKQLALPGEPCWLEQVHGTHLVAVETYPQPPVADGCVAAAPGQVCVVMTADCLPVLLCDKEGNQVMALHGGWRSLAAGILAKGVDRFTAAPADLLVYLGPAISQPHFEVGPEVCEQIAQNLSLNVTEFATPNPYREGHFFLDLYQVARLQLQALGVQSIYGGDYCTYAEPSRFYSYRRDGVTGRMASLIWKTR